MRACLWLVVVSVVLGAVAIDAAPPEPAVDDTSRLDITSNTRVAVHVYSQVADFTPADERIAIEVATDVFATARVDVVWTLCTPGVCTTPSAEALKLRVVTSPANAEPNPGVLGQAMVDPRARTGVLATVFIDRTRHLASDLGIDYRVLLGRAMAHELAHLLLGTSVHGSGLMRDFWSQGELLGTRRNDWILDPLDAATIRDRLVRRGGSGMKGAS